MENSEDGTFLGSLLFAVQLVEVLINFTHVFDTSHFDSRHPFRHSLFVGEQVALWPNSSEVDEIIVHVVDENLINKVFELWPLFHKFIAVLPFRVQIFCFVDSITERPDVICMSLVKVNQNNFVLCSD